jgi:hypothetical protein
MKYVHFVFGRDTKGLRELRVSKESLAHQELMDYQAFQGGMDEMEAKGRKVGTFCRNNTAVLLKKYDRTLQHGVCLEKPISSRNAALLYLLSVVVTVQVYLLLDSIYYCTSSYPLS